MLVAGRDHLRAVRGAELRLSDRLSQSVAVVAGALRPPPWSGQAVCGACEAAR